MEQKSASWEDGWRPDRGPWTVVIWQRIGGRIVVLQSADFHHDAALEITGDFGSWEDRMAYANWLAEVLTRATVSAKDEHGK